MAVVKVFRELCKFGIVALLWIIPIAIAYYNGNNGFLWLFILSIIFTVGTFSHYEDLERIDRIGDKLEGTDNEQRRK